MVADVDALAATPEHAEFLHRVLERSAGRRAEATVQADLPQIEAATRRRASGQVGGSLRNELANLEQASRIDLDVPTASRIPAAAGLKAGVKKLVGFYLNHVGQQVIVLGGAMVRLGRATAGEIGRLDDEVQAMRQEVTQLADAVRRLEAGEHPGS